MTNIFKVTRIYPFNKGAVGLPARKTVLHEETSLNYIPLYSPSVHLNVSSRSEFSAEEIELFELRYANGYNLTHDKRYNKWLEVNHNTIVPPSHQGQNLNSPLLGASSDEGRSHDMHRSHGRSLSISSPRGVYEPNRRRSRSLSPGRRTDSVRLLCSHTSSLGKYLRTPAHYSKPVVNRDVKNCGRLLTSAENIELMERKEKEKKAKAEAKEARAKLREEKKWPQRKKPSATSLTPFHGGDDSYYLSSCEGDLHVPSSSLPIKLIYLVLNSIRVQLTPGSCAWV